MRGRMRVVLALLLGIGMVFGLGGCGAQGSYRGIRTDISSFREELKSLPRNPNFNNTINNGDAPCYEKKCD